MGSVPASGFCVADFTDLWGNAFEIASCKGPPPEHYLTSLEKKLPSKTRLCSTDARTTEVAHLFFHRREVFVVCTNGIIDCYKVGGGSLESAHFIHSEKQTGLHAPRLVAKYAASLRHKADVSSIEAKINERLEQDREEYLASMANFPLPQAGERDRRSTCASSPSLDDGDGTDCTTSSLPRTPTTPPDTPAQRWEEAHPGQLVDTSNWLPPRKPEGRGAANPTAPPLGEHERLLRQPTCRQAVAGSQQRAQRLNLWPKQQRNATPGAPERPQTALQPSERGNFLGAHDGTVSVFDLDEEPENKGRRRWGMVSLSSVSLRDRARKDAQRPPVPTVPKVPSEKKFRSWTWPSFSRLTAQAC